MGLRSLVIALLLCWPASALGQNRIQALLDTVHDDESLLAASRTLFDLAETNRRATLQAALGSKNQHVRWIAAMALVWNGHNPSSPELALPVLVDAVKHGSPEIRSLAFRKLDDLSSYSGYRDICAPVIDEDVIAGLRDPADEVNRDALGALSACPSLPVSIAAREIAEGRGRDSVFRLSLIRNLSRRGPEAQEAADALIAALDDDYHEIRDAAAKALRSAGVDPALYVPRIIDEVKSGGRGRPGVHPTDKLIAVAPAAAQWAPEIIDMHRDEPNPHVRSQLRIVLTKLGTPEADQAERAAAREQAKASLVRRAPTIAVFGAAVAVVVLLVARGWGVFLGFVFPALPVLAAVVFVDDGAWKWIPVLVSAPICSLMGAVAGFLFAAGESGEKRMIGLIGTGLSVVAMVASGLLLVVLYYGLAPLGAG
jgi:hypothetical protein